MRKSVKIGIFLLVVGVVLTMFGIANNGLQTVYWDRGFHVSKQTAVSKTYHPNTIKSITLTSNASVTIKRGNRLSVQVASKRKLPTIAVSDGELTVKGKNGNYNDVGFFTSSNSLNRDQVTITIPQDKTLERLQATTSQVGDLTLQDVNVKEMRLDANDSSDVDLTMTNVKVDQPLQLQAGDVQLTNVTAPSFEVQASDVTINRSRFEKTDSTIKANGDVSLQQSRFTGLQLETSDGDVDVSHVKSKGQLAVKTTDGDISLTNLDFKKQMRATSSEGDIDLSTSRNDGVTADTTDGDLDIFGWENDDQNHYQIRTAARHQYQLSTQDGDITVTATD